MQPGASCVLQMYTINLYLGFFFTLIGISYKKSEYSEALGSIRCIFVIEIYQ